ncbi:putative disease resistance protein RGA4 [Herrania umbratica]|uniref:Disease resistance protein RGA4 n=1 Tax=Herrania umbratica TaxID=108875 RepID=A0A6J1BBK3_9ROSI|nr:putative disease resistance protein RGA4 [Herrania umbratica]
MKEKQKSTIQLTFPHWVLARTATMFFFEALSTIREVIVSKFFNFLLHKLGSSNFLQFASEKQIHEGIHKLRKALQEIHAVLDDAEERQLKDQLVKIWLSNVQNLAYDVDDILDEFATKNFEMQFDGETSR